jgi:hypothetical protein
MGFKDEMQEHDEQFETDRESGGTLPDATYSPATVTEARVEPQDDGSYNMMWKFEADYEIDGKPTTGAIRKWWNDITNPENVDGRKYLARDMKRVGYEGPGSSLEEACEQEVFIGLNCEIAVKTKSGQERDYTNVYINRLSPGSPSASGDPVGVGAGGSEPATDDDIPF